MNVVYGDVTDATLSFPDGATTRRGARVKIRCSYQRSQGDVVQSIGISKRVGTGLAPVFSWQSSDGAVTVGASAGNNYTGRISTTDYVNTQNYLEITVDPSLLTDNGGYMCLVFPDTIANIQTSVDSDLVVNAIPSLPVMSLSSTDLKTGGTVTITCTANTGRPAGTLNWYQKMPTDGSYTSIDAVNQGPVANSDGYTFDVTGTYTVNPLTSTHDGAVYKCEADNSILDTTESRFSATETLSVKYGVQNIKITPAEGPYIPGDSLTCQAEGKPAPSYEWQRGNGTLNMPETISGAVLNIPEDVGAGVVNYTCVASNTIDTTYSISASKQINITEAPTTKATSPTASSPTSAPTTTPEPDNLPIILGSVFGVVGAIIVIIVIIVIICLCFRKKDHASDQTKFKPGSSASNGTPMGSYEIDMDDNSNKKKNIGEAPFLEVTIDDRPRSRKPIQMQEGFDKTDFGDIRRV